MGELMVAVVDRITECIYCGKKQLSRTHVFPDNMGGKAQPLLACRQCNNMFNRYIDVPAQRYVVRCFALAQLGESRGGKSKRDAFRDADIRCPVFNPDIAFQFDDTGALVPKIKLVKGKGGYLPATKAKTIIPKMVEGKAKEYEMQQINDFLMNRDVKEVVAGAIRVERVRPRDLVTSVNVCGLTTNLDPRLLAKIVYEHSAVWRLHDHGVFSAFRERFLGRMSIEAHEVDPRLSRRVVAIGNLRAVADFSKLKYKPFFYIYLGVSESGTTYAIVGFYGVVKYLVAVGKCVSDWARYDFVKKHVTMYFMNKSKIGVVRRPRGITGLSFEHYGKIADALDFDAVHARLRNGGAK
jgi:hypothetical protein